MKFGWLTEYNKGNIFVKNHAESQAETLAPELFLFFKKAFYEAKVSGLQLGFNIFRWP